MASKYPTNKQRTNYARLCRAIIDLSADVLRELLKKQILLTDISTELKKIPRKVTEKISKEQWGYIDKSATGGTYIKQFDVTLLCLVLRILSVRDLAKTLEITIGYQALYTSVQNCPALSSDPNTKLKQSELKEVLIIAKNQQYIHSKDEFLWKLYTHLCPAANQKLVHPSVPWGGPNMPNPADTTTGDDIERLRVIRNKTYGHLTSTEMPDKEFNSCWETLEEIMIRMDQELPGNNFKACLDTIKIERMDADSHMELFDRLKEMAETEEKMQKELADIQEKVTNIAIRQDSVAKEQGNVVTKQKRVAKEQGNVVTKQKRVAKEQGNVVTKQKRVAKSQNKMGKEQEGVVTKQRKVEKSQQEVARKQEEVVESQAGMIKEIREWFQQSKEQVKNYEVERIRPNGPLVFNSTTNRTMSTLSPSVPYYSGQLYQGHATLQIERHKKDRTFVTTNAVSTGLDILAERGILIYSGLPGQGKTTNALEVMTQCQKTNPDYKFFELDNVREWKKIIDPNVPSIVLLNDVIGKTNIDTGLINDGDKYFPNILANVQEGKVKVIMTIRKLLLDKNRLKLERYKLFDAKHTIDLTSEEFKLDRKNKEKILLRHCEINAIEICCLVEDENYYEIDIHDEKSVIKIGRWTIDKILSSDPILGFPFACYLFCCERKYTRLGWKFFTKPTQYLIDEIRGLINSDSTKIEKVQYCIMAYMVLKNGKLDTQLDDEMFNRIITSLEFQKPTKIERNEAIKELLSTYIVKGVNSQYEFKHQSILESVAVCFTENDPCLLLELCSEGFIIEFVRPHSYTETEGEVVCKVESEVYNTIVKRFVSIWKHVIHPDEWGSIWWINHPLSNDKDFVECLFGEIKSKIKGQNYKLNIDIMFKRFCEYGESTVVLDEIYKLLTPSKETHNIVNFEDDVNVIKWQLDHNLLDGEFISEILADSPHVSLINHPCVTLHHVVAALSNTSTTCDSSVFEAILTRWPVIESCHVLTMLEHLVILGMPVDSIQTVLKCRPDMITDVNIKRMFTLACVGVRNNIEILEYLLNIKHDNLNSKTIPIYIDNNDKLTNLHIAAYYGKVEVCKKLVELGLRLDDKTVSGLSVLQMVILGYCHLQSYEVHISKALANFFKTIDRYKYIVQKRETRQIQTDYKHQLEYMMNSLTIDITDFDLTFDTFGFKLIHYCVLFDDLSMIETLYNINHQLVHVTNKDNMSGIHIAALMGTSDTFMKLVELGVSVNNKIDGLSVLQLAMMGYSHCDFSKIVPTYSILQSFIITHYTMMYNRKNYGDIFTFLLQHEEIPQTDSDIALDLFGSKLIHYCVLFNDLSMIKKLYNINQQLVHVTNNDNVSGIHIAALFGLSDIFLKLVEFGVSVTNRINGLSVLQLAMMVYSHRDLSKIDPTFSFLQSPIIKQYTMWYNRQNYGDILTFLLQHEELPQTDLDIVLDEFGSKLIHYCVLNDDLSMIKKLYNINQQLIHVTNNDNMSGIHIAAFLGRSKIFMKLVEFGVSVTNRINGLSVLQLAMMIYSHRDLRKIDPTFSFLQSPIITHYKFWCYRQNYGDILTFLLQHEEIPQTDLDMDLDEFGSKLIHYCVLYNHFPMIQKLYNINHQLVYVTNNDNMSGIHIAALFGKSYIFMKLVELGVSVSGNTSKSGYSALYFAMIGFITQDSPFRLHLIHDPVINMYDRMHLLGNALKNTINCECIITSLLEHKDICLTDFDIEVDEFGTPFIHYCVVFDSLSLIKLLYQKYPQILSREVVDKYKAKSVAIDSSNEVRKVTPVELSVLMGRSAILQFLLSCPDVVNDKEVHNLIQLVSEGKMYVGYSYDFGLDKELPDFLYFLESTRPHRVLFGFEDNYKSISKALQDHVVRAAVRM